MIIENKLTKKEFRKLILKELIFGRKISLIIFGLYCMLWKTSYSIAKIGGLRKNVPIFLGISLLLLLMLIYTGIIYHKHMKNSFLYKAGSKISIDDTQLSLQVSEFNNKVIYQLNDLTRIEEDRKWFSLFFKDKSFVPVSKVLDTDSLENLKEKLKAYKKIGRSYKRLGILSFIIVTIVGSYYIGTCAVNFNGALSWKINEWKTDKKIKLEDDNFYTSKLEGIIHSVKTKVDLEPNLMTNNLVVKFEKDGTITSIETYIYGFDKNYKLKSGYLLYYDKSKENKLTIHKQDWGDGGNTKYDPENDLSVVINMLNNIPVKEDIKQWNEKSYAVAYKGIRNWGYNLEGIRLINKEGKTEIPSIPSQQIIGPTVSVYCPGKEQVITPHRFVYKLY